MDWLTIKEFIKDSVKFILIVFTLMFLMVYVVSITQVVGNSMSPTLENGEVLILNKAKYRLSEVKRFIKITFNISVSSDFFRYSGSININRFTNIYKIFVYSYKMFNNISLFFW